MEFTIKSSKPSSVLELEYEYDKETLAGFAPNPSTNDNLHLGQLTEDSIFIRFLMVIAQLVHQNGTFLRHTYSASRMARTHRS